MSTDQSTALDGLFAEDDDEPEIALDVTGFKPGRMHPKPPKSDVRQTSLDAGLQDRAGGAASRQARKAPRPASVKTTSEFRRSVFYRTGRSVQINLKGRPEDRELFHRMCDDQDWVRGQCLEYALAALAEKIDAGPDDPFWLTRSFRGVDGPLDA